MRRSLDQDISGEYDEGRMSRLNDRDDIYKASGHFEVELDHTGALPKQVFFIPVENMQVDEHPPERGTYIIIF